MSKHLTIGYVPTGTSWLDPGPFWYIYCVDYSSPRNSPGIIRVVARMTVEPTEASIVEEFPTFMHWHENIDIFEHPILLLEERVLMYGKTSIALDENEYILSLPVSDEFVTLFKTLTTLRSLNV